MFPVEKLYNFCEKIVLYCTSFSLFFYIHQDKGEKMNTLRLNKTNIAIINNDKTQAKHLGFSLKSLGYNVYHYSSPLLVLQDEKIDNIHLFIIDL